MLMGKKSHWVSILLVLIFLVSVSTNYSVTIASSSEGDPVPPSGGTGGGGGGGFLFFDYYIPLIFDETHPDGLASVSVTTFQPSLMITSFAMDESGVNQRSYDTPTTIFFDPSKSPGLTNGSLIRLTSPAQVVVHRLTDDISEDKSFAYTVFPDRMRGFEYRAPFDGYATVFTEDQLTNVNFLFPNGTSLTRTIFQPFAPQTYPVVKGTYINTTEFTTVTFYSPDHETGYKAALGIPRYLRGSEYIIPQNLYDLDKNETDLSYVEIIPTAPTEIVFTYKGGENRTFEIFGQSTFSLSSDLVGIHAIRAEIDVNLFFVSQYGGLTRSSSIQMIEAPEMRAGEIFAIVPGFSASFAILQPQTNFTVAEYTEQGYLLANRGPFELEKYDSVSIPTKLEPSIAIGNNSLFGVSVSPGRSGHFMDASMAFVLLPLNQQTLYRNVSGITATWYRFTNLAIGSIDIFPDPAEEFSSLLIEIKVISNGSLPSSSFKLEVDLDDEVIIEDEIDFLPVGETLTYSYRTFLRYNQQNMSLSVQVDVENEVTEINEDDNNFSGTIEVFENLRLRVSIGLVVFAALAFIGRTIYKKIKLARQIQKSRVDAILTIEEEL